MIAERWLPVVGYEGLYEVSDFGRIRSLDRETSNRWGTRTIIRGRTMKLGHCSGYASIRLWSRGGLCRTALVHRVVLEAFVGPCPEGMQCRHFPDRDRKNNRLENLSWGTVVENARDKEIHKTVARGERQGHAHLTADQVAEILVLGSQGIPYRSIAERFGIDRSTVSGIMRGRGWRHLGGPRGTRSKVRGERHGFSKLTQEAVRDIRRRSAQGARSVDLAAEYGVAAGTIQGIAARRSWSWLPDSL